MPDEHFPEERERGGCVFEAQDISDEAENTVIVVAVTCYTLYSQPGGLDLWDQ